MLITSNLAFSQWDKIFQDPMTSLNPVLTIGRQIGEALELHKGMDRASARKRSPTCEP